MDMKGQRRRQRYILLVVIFCANIIMAVVWHFKANFFHYKIFLQCFLNSPLEISGISSIFVEWDVPKKTSKQKEFQ